MKKDSFTFSDKLKKSKTLPLSKRIPSRVGGEVKAKRTLFERAQRDLPFIIVAALALLLLPFLSRESGDIDTPTVVWNNGDTYEEDFNSKPKSAEEEIALSSFRNPLDLIIRRGEKDSSSRDTIDPYASGSESSASEAESSADKYGSTRSSYASEEYSSSPSTSRYGKTVKRSVRNSINRVPTSIGTLSKSGMIGANGGGAPSHNLSFGSRSKDASPRVQGPGVRPVALQPLTAAGKGRDLTGSDALYAEAARSIGAMNRPGAKQALFDAQLADLDGKPLGDTKSAEAKGEPGRPGAGGGPSNNWSHTNQKPWWWDMMKDRSQRRWELWHYNWEKMASDSLIALTRGLASCIVTGSNDFGVNNFLGKPGGSSDYECWVNGKKVEELGSRSDYVAGSEIKETSKDGGKEEHVPSWLYEDYRKVCEKTYQGKLVQTSSGRQSALDVRLRCLGLKLSELKNMVQMKKEVDCVGTNYDPMYIDISRTRNGKPKMKSVGFYVMGKKEGCKDDSVLLLSKAEKPGVYTIEGVNRSSVNKIVVYKAKTNATIHYPEGNEDPTFTQGRDNLDQFKDKQGNYYSEDDTQWESGDYDKAFNVAKKAMQGCLSEKELQKILRPKGWKDANVLDICKDIAFKDSTFRPVKINDNDSIVNDYQGDGSRPNAYQEKIKSFADCQYNDVYIDTVPSNHVFATTIQNPGKRTIAFVLEYVQGNAYSDDKAPSYFDNEKSTLSERTGYRVVRKIDYKNYPHLVSNNADGTQTFIGEVQVGTSSTLKNDNTVRDEKVKAEPGFGKVIWVTTDDMTTEGVTEGTVVKEPQANLLFPTPRKLSAICNYRWGCAGGTVCPGGKNPEMEQENYCYVADENDPDNKSLRKYYQATIFDGNYVKKNNTPISADELENVNLDKVVECQPLCKCKDETYRLARKPGRDCKDVTGMEIDLTGCKDCQEAEGDGYCELEGKVYKSVKVVENGQEYYFRVTNQDIPGAKATVPCTPICLDKAKALGILQTTGKDSNIPLDETPLTTEDRVKAKGIPVPSEVCPFCSGKCYMGNDVYPCTSFVGNDGNTYHVRTSITPISGRTEFPCTTICAKKAAALGLGIYATEAGSPKTPIEPVLTEDVNKISPVKPGDENLCPYCSGPESPVAPDPEPKKVGPLASRTINFANGCYEKYYIDSNYDFNEFKEAVIDNAVAQGVNTFIIEGHASGRVANCPEGNCNELLAYDRAIYLYNQMAPLLNGVYNVELIDETDKSKFGTGVYPKPGTNGLPKYTDCENHWPIKRNTLMSISYDSSKPTIKITLRGLGISESVTGKQSSRETKEEAKINIRQGEDDRSAIIYPNQEIVDSD
jgi:hypothetical protein